MKQFLEIGKIVGTHGVRGEMRVEPWADSPDFLCGFDRLYFDKGTRELEVLAARPHKRIVLMKLSGVDTMEDAAALGADYSVFADMGDLVEVTTTAE